MDREKKSVFFHLAFLYKIPAGTGLIKQIMHVHTRSNTLNKPQCKQDNTRKRWEDNALCTYRLFSKRLTLKRSQDTTA